MSDETYYPRHASFPVELLRRPDQFDNTVPVERYNQQRRCPLCGQGVDPVLPQVSAVGQ